MKLNWRLPLASGATPEEVLESSYYGGQSDAQVAQLLTALTGIGVSPRSVTGKRQNMGLGKTRRGVPLVPPSDLPRFDEPPRVEGDALVLVDAHVPFHDAAFVNQVVNLADRWDVPNLILAGDVLDLVALSGFAPEFGEEKPELEDELATAGRFFDACQGFDRILWLSGGHELRFLRKLERGIGMGRLAAMVTDLPNLEATEYHWCELGDDWVVAHFSNTSVIPGRVPTLLARKYRRSVAGGHEHVWGLVQDESGESLAVSIGVCCDPARLAYAALRATTRPAVCQGAFVLKRGKPWLLSPRWTDWAALRAIVWER